jgi:hypothetical protein
MALAGIAALRCSHISIQVPYSASRLQKKRDMGAEAFARCRLQELLDLAFFLQRERLGESGTYRRMGDRKPRRAWSIFGCS